MGTEAEVEKCWIINEDGTRTEWSGLKSVTYDVSFESTDIHTVDLAIPYEASFSITLRWPKFYRCKNRKRFKKLMMSVGLYDRKLMCELTSEEHNARKYVLAFKVYDQHDNCFRGYDKTDMDICQECYDELVSFIETEADD